MIIVHSHLEQLWYLCNSNKCGFLGYSQLSMSVCRRFSSTAKFCSKMKSTSRQAPQKFAVGHSTPSTSSSNNVECSSIIIPSRTHRRHCKPTYASEDKFHLPAEHEWRVAFPTTGAAFKHRVLLRNHESAARVAEAFIPAGCKDKVIVEAFAGMTLLYIDILV